MTTNAAKTQWQYLEKRSHSWRQQLYLKGKVSVQVGTKECGF